MRLKTFLRQELVVLLRLRSIKYRIILLIISFYSKFSKIDKYQENLSLRPVFNIKYYNKPVYHQYNISLVFIHSGLIDGKCYLKH